MKQYKIGNKVVKANNVVDAVKKFKDDIQKYMSPDRKYYVMLDGHWGEIYDTKTQETIWSGKYTGGSAKQLLEDWKHANNILDTCKDEDIESLSKEEEQAIEDYKKAIAETKDPKLLRLFAHILKEEIEHLEELQNEEIVDTCKRK